MEFVLGIAAAFFFALGTVLQEREAQAVPEDEAMNAGVLLKLARRPIWMLGIAADGLGFICQAAALHFGQLAVVQPLLAASVVFALPFGRFIVHRKVTRKDILGAAAVTAGLVFFLIMANPEDGVDDASTMGWIISGAIAGAVCAVLVVAARGKSASPRAALLGMSAGILFGFSAGLTLTVVDSLDEGVVELLTDWHLYALILVGWISMTLSQAALQTGALPAAVSTQMSLDPVVSVLLGVLIFQESIHDTFLEGAVALFGLAVMIGGLFYLARAQGEESAAPAPAG